MADPLTEQRKSVDQLLEENLELKARLRRQEELYENSNMELLKIMVESERQAKELKKLNSLLKKSFLNTIEIIQNVIEIRDPGSKDHAERVARGAYFIARRLIGKNAEAQKIMIAAKIHEIGKIAIPQEILAQNDLEMSDHDRKLYRRYPILGAACLEEVERFKEVARIIKHQMERFDGRGLPDGLQGEEIPIGSRIIAIADALDTIFFMMQKHNTIVDALNEIQGDLGSKFDGQLFPHLYAFAMESYGVNESPRDRKISFQQLTPGMVLSRDLRTITNALLLPLGTKLTDALIEKLLKHQNIDPINGGIYVLNE